MEVKVIRSNRRTVAIQVNSDLSVTLRAPNEITDEEIQKILKEKDAWIKRSIEKIRINKKESGNRKRKKLSEEEVKKLADKAIKYIPKRVKYFAPIVGVDYGSITIRNQKTRWGSCSSKGNLNFNCLLMLAPKEVIDYVVVHELCHRKEMNHSQAFWDEVQRVLPEYERSREWLKKEGALIIQKERE